MPRFLYQPVSPFKINQRFGENKACVDLATGTKVIVCNGTPPPGYRVLYKEGHTGLDLSSKHGQPVYCAQDGKVDWIDTREMSGLDVRVITEFGGKRYRHIYEHLLGYQPKVGDMIKAGDLIGWADNTGKSSGDHLHFELQEWRDGKWVPIDPLPLMDPLFALTAAGLWRQIKEIAARIAELTADLARK